MGERNSAHGRDRLRIEFAVVGHMTRKTLTVYRGHVNNHILHSDHGVGSRKLSQFTAKSVGDFREVLRDLDLD